MKNKCLRLLARLPLRVLYAVADAICPLLYHLFRYRRKVVAENLRRSFPEKTPKELRKIERDFYHFLCDYAVETIKMLDFSVDDIRRRMTFEGISEIEQAIGKKGFVFIYLGHYGNWEWISSLPQWLSPSIHGGQLYKPLRDKELDALFMDLRTRFGCENIDKNIALRRILQLKREGKKALLGFISDQSPLPNNIHTWMTFLQQDTPLFSGMEKIARKIDAGICFADVSRTARGHYHCHLRMITDDINALPEFELTKRCTLELERIILRDPSIWLWSHRRWKHKRRLPHEETAETPENTPTAQL